MSRLAAAQLHAQRWSTSAGTSEIRSVSSSTDYEERTRVFQWIPGEHVPVELPYATTYHLLAERSFYVPMRDVKQFSSRPKWTHVLAYHLSKIGVPQGAQPALIVRILDYIEEADNDSFELPILVHIVDGTYHYLRLDHDNDILDRVMRQSSEAYRAMLIPAAQSSIQGLENVRLDDPTLAPSSACIICMEGLLLDHHDDHHSDNINVVPASQDEDDDHDQDQDQSLVSPVPIPAGSARVIKPKRRRLS
ncbi:hypothetical protein L3X38_020568 [Prunus dulcis]|uniref:Uncharacterized protein n=1 Tax=Prunus dulcis TaxID=3755 RepID=A0AAD4WDB2_PRUDU|nr:hypothetical protein L3X38_020568 [Prunus dulcis]